MYLFSIIVPIYNAPAEYLTECIESTLRQNVDNMEILLIDDGSDEYCKAICKTFADRDKRIIYFRQDNQGVSVARNNGLNHATGEFIVFLDADDHLPDSFLRTICDKIPDDRPDILMYDYSSSYSNKGLTRRLSPGKSAKLNSSNIINAILGINGIFLPYDVGTLWAKLIKRSVIEENNIRFPIGVKKGQDTVFMLYVYLHSNNIAYISETGYIYRKNDRSVTHKLNPDIVCINENLLSQYDEFLSCSGRGSERVNILNNIRVKMLLGEYLTMYFCHRKNPKKRSVLQKEYSDLISSEPYKTAINNADIPGIKSTIEQHALKNKNTHLIWLIKSVKDNIKRIVIREYE